MQLNHTKELKRPAICFVANYHKTAFFSAIAKQLEKSGIDIFWITVSRRLRKALSETNPASRILLLNKETPTSPERAKEIRINELIYGDRALRHDRNAEKYLKSIQQPFLEFISKNSIKLVFGELTWAHEIAFHRLLLESSSESTYLNPHTIRIPSNRFAFFQDESQSVFYNSSATSDDDSESHTIEIRKPDYLSINNNLIKTSQSLRSRLNRIKRFFTEENIDVTDPTIIPRKLIRLRNGILEEINKEAYHLVKREPVNSKLLTSKYLFAPLHKQPEASIDVIGRYYEDQYLNILNIWRNLPSDWLILVKEHTNAIGDRPYSFYRKLQQLRNVILVDENFDSHTLIKNSQFVATVSGTAAYEAALLGKPSITFGKCFFNNFTHCKKLDLTSLTELDFEEFSKKPIDNQQSVIKKIIENSFPGNIGDPITNPSVMDARNIADVTSGFLKIITCP